MILTWPVIGALLGGATAVAVGFLRRRASMLWPVTVGLAAVAVYFLVAHEYPESGPLWALGWVVGMSVAAAWTRPERSSSPSQPANAGEHAGPDS